MTNKLSLPQAIVDAISNDQYERGDCHFSCTELLQPPRIRTLKIKHAHEITEDVSERIWSLLGQSVHSILERANNPDNAISEKRYFSKFGQYTVSAQIDSLDLRSGTLTDFKTTSVWKFLKNKPPPDEYVQQVNIQSEILRSNGLEVNALQIVGILRDWQIREAKNNPDYPQFQVAVQQIPMWSRAKTIDFIFDRINKHLDAEINLPECSASERWAKDSKFAVMKGTNKRAVKLCDSLGEAEDYISNGSGDRIELRPGEVRRCENYCVVAPFCDQYKASKK